jgi:hypothetical protein
MLFRPEVHKYLIEIRDVAGNFYADKFKENEAAVTGMHQDVLDRLNDVRKRLSVLWKQRNDVFRPELHLGSVENNNPGVPPSRKLAQPR